jgi:hypothetical protein
MKLTIIALVSLLTSITSYSKEHVSGHTRSNGTYVAAYDRSDRDSTRSNNYGRPSSYSNYQEVNHPESRDYDHDGIPNISDMDDNNNGILDDNEGR